MRTTQIFYTLTLSLSHSRKLSLSFQFSRTLTLSLPSFVRTSPKYPKTLEIEGTKSTIALVRTIQTCWYPFHVRTRPFSR